MVDITDDDIFLINEDGVFIRTEGDKLLHWQPFEMLLLSVEKRGDAARASIAVLRWMLDELNETGKFKNKPRKPERQIRDAIQKILERYDERSSPEPSRQRRSAHR